MNGGTHFPDHVARLDGTDGLEVGRHGAFVVALRVQVIAISVPFRPSMLDSVRLPQSRDSPSINVGEFIFADATALRQPDRDSEQVPLEQDRERLLQRLFREAEELLGTARRQVFVHVGVVSEKPGRVPCQLR